MSAQLSSTAGWIDGGGGRLVGAGWWRLLFPSISMPDAAQGEKTSSATDAAAVADLEGYGA